MLPYLTNFEGWSWQRLAECSGCSLANGLDLVGAKAHAVNVCSAGNPVTVTTTQGETYEEAVQNLKEATILYLDEFPMKVHSHPATSYNFDFITRNVTRLSKNTISH